MAHNVVRGNVSGLDAAGTGALPNSFAGGYVLAGAGGNLIQGKVLSGHPAEGLRIADSGTTGNRVEANLIRWRNPPPWPRIGGAFWFL